MGEKLIGSCSSCGRAVEGEIRFIGDPTFHCKVPPCWPMSLWLLDNKISEDAYLRKVSDE